MRLSTKRFLSIGAAALLSIGTVPALFADDAPAAPVAQAPTAKKKVSRRRKKKKKVHAKAPKRAATAAVAAAPTPEETPANALDAWCKSLKKRIVHAQTKQNQVVAVAAVRGAEAPEAPPLYWKGKSAPGLVEGSDAEELDQALNKAMSGDAVAARMRLESFISTHPNSPLAPDAKDTLTRLNEQYPPAK